MGYPSMITCSTCGTQQKSIRYEDNINRARCKKCGATLEVAPGPMASYATFMGAGSHPDDRTWSADEAEAHRVAVREERLSRAAFSRAKRVELGVHAEVEHVYGLRDLVLAHLASREPDGDDFDLFDGDLGKARRAAMGELARALGAVYEVDLGANDVGDALAACRGLEWFQHRHVRGAWSLVLDAVDAWVALRPPFPGLLMGSPIESLIPALQQVYRTRRAYHASLADFIVQAVEALLGGPPPTLTSSDLLDWGFDDRKLDPYREDMHA